MSLGTLLVLIVLLLAVAAIIRSMVKKKRKGGCSCGCSDCSGSCCTSFTVNGKTYGTK